MRNTCLPAALIVIAALMAGCSGTDDGPDTQQGDWAYLHQQTLGAAPTIRLHLDQPSVPLEDQIFGWLFYRSANQRYFSLTARYLVDALFEARLPGGYWDDGPSGEALREIDREFRYTSPIGDEETVSVTVAWDDPALRPGVRYYHRVQRIVEPMARAGSGAPIAQALSPAQTAQIDVDPADALSKGSTPTPGVTYISPPVLQLPRDGTPDRSTTKLSFEWSAAAGADQYVLQVFPSDDPTGERNPSYQKTLRRTATGTMRHTFESALEPGTRFYWRVGARKSGEALPVNQQLLQRGWVYSSMRGFTTAQAPPPPPGN